MLTGGLLTGCGGDSKGDSDSSVAKNVTNSESVYNCPTEVAISNCEAGTCSACTCESGACADTTDTTDIPGFTGTASIDFKTTLDEIDDSCNVVDGAVTFNVSSDDQAKSCKNESNSRYLVVFSCSFVDELNEMGEQVVNLMFSSAQVTDSGNGWIISKIETPYNDERLGSFNSSSASSVDGVNYSCLMN